jgi:hypothetical protein
VVHYDNPLFDIEDQDVDYHNEPQGFRSMTDLIGSAVPRELATSESDRLFVVSAEEPASVVEATQEAVWCRAMIDELKYIEENKTWSLTQLPSGRHAIGLKWMFKVKKNQLGEVARHKARLIRDGNSGMGTRYLPGTRPDGYGYGDDFLPMGGTRTRPEPRWVRDGYFFTRG